MKHKTERTDTAVAEVKKISALKRIWNLVSNILVTALVLIAIYCCLGTLKQKQTGEIFFPFGYRPVVILSGSMEDTLMTNGLVLVKKTKDIQEDDIVFFETEDGTPVIHRCIAVEENGKLITKGDANPVADWTPVKEEQIQGKVVKIMNWRADVMEWLASLNSEN